MADDPLLLYPIGSETPVAVRVIRPGCGYPGTPCQHCQRAESRWCDCRCDQLDAHGCCITTDPEYMTDIGDGRRVCRQCAAAREPEPEPEVREPAVVAPPPVDVLAAIRRYREVTG